MTGGASGIGLSISPLMAKESAKVVIAVFNEAGAKEAAENIKKQGGEAAGVFLDAGQAYRQQSTLPLNNIERLRTR
ncbi:UNVERIFIED_ORG: NAD(P)-dependent dehydrogenase (short-subunit alcohol dehydrogenase family) [Bacillus sp. B2I3]|nr:NAD(P)-dependent dehydrogenase (short-subunit alcohol dehydrogenase family) [Bacillus sp. B2I3]